VSRKLKFHHRIRLQTAYHKRKFDKLTGTLDRLTTRGFDIAGVPFQLLDQAFCDADVDGLEGMATLARFTHGGQPDLLRAIVNGVSHDNQSALDSLIQDVSAHPMTRFEAMGWAVFLRNRAGMPTSGMPVRDVFQFWDAPKPPQEIDAGIARWRDVAKTHSLYDEGAAADYIANHFGTDARRDFLTLWHPAVKSDVFRLYRLAQDGGCYCDADSNPELFAADFLKNAGDGVWLSAMTNVPNCVAINGLIAAPAQSPIIQRFLEQVLRNISERTFDNIFWLSGPGALTGYLYQSGATPRILPLGRLKSDVFRQFDAPYKTTEANWRVFEHKRGMSNDPGLAQTLQRLAADPPHPGPGPTDGTGPITPTIP